MTDINSALNQISGVVYQVTAIANQVNALIHPDQAPVPAPTMRPDQWQPTYAPQAAQPVPTQSAPTGLRGIWDRIVSFFRNLFNRGTGMTSAMAAQSVGSWPASNPDARAQLWAMFPTGRGNALGLVPFTVTRNQNAIVMDASGLSKAAIAMYQGEYFFYNKNDAPVRIAQVTSQRAANGSTQFNICMESGKQVSASISADGHTLGFDNYTVTLN